MTLVLKEDVNNLITFNKTKIHEIHQSIHNTLFTITKQSINRNSKTEVKKRAGYYLLQGSEQGCGLDLNSNPTRTTQKAKYMYWLL